MATPKLNPSRSIAVIPSDYCNIPNPALFIVNSVVSVAPDKNIYYDETQDLIALGVKIGDILYNYDYNQGSTITGIAPDGSGGTIITFNMPVTFTVGGNIQIYSGQDNSTGCVLYIGTGGNLEVITEGGDNVVFSSVPSGLFFPVQVIAVKKPDEAASNILALR